MNLDLLTKINNENIRAAGPRYSPIVDPEAPNLEIAILFSAFEALAASNKYRNFLMNIVEGISTRWQSLPTEVKELFTSLSPENLIHQLKLLQIQPPGKSEITLIKLEKYVTEITKILQDKMTQLYDEELKLDQNSKEYNEKQAFLSHIRALGSTVSTINSFIRSPDYKLISTNRALLLGEWGTGKTHLLCDITKGRTCRGLPTLFFLAHRLPLKVNPLEAICQMTRIANSPRALLHNLNTLGKASNSRALLIIDGINEADRTVWKKYIKEIALTMKNYNHVALIVSCRSPFDRHIFIENSRKEFVQLTHNGFQEIEFDAQRAFFKYYQIPNPHVPLLTPEFTRPLFLKIICKTFSGKTKSSKTKWMNEIASGQKSMTKLLEDFVVSIGGKIETEFNLPLKTCWKIMKGEIANSGKMVGITVSMANSVLDYTDPLEALSVIVEFTQKPKHIAKAILKRMITDGLLVEDTVWENTGQKDVIRLPYQRFSDHLIARHLLREHLNSTSENSIRRSFYIDQPLGKVFELDRWEQSYMRPGLASAIMLEFPERVKKTLPSGDRELVFYLPKKRRLAAPLVETFLEGVVWRNKDSFSNQTQKIFRFLLDSKHDNTERKTFETLVSLACRINHPYSAWWLYGYLEKLKIIDRDLKWSEFLRNSHEISVIYRLLNWVDDSDKSNLDFDAVKNLTLLISLFLTAVDRAFRDRATKALVLLGEVQPRALFENTIHSLKFNDPYVSERMLAASYGVLMRSWSFSSQTLKECIIDFANDLNESMFKNNAPFATTHVLSCDYALGILELASRINKKSFEKRIHINLKSPFQKPIVKIPTARKIAEKYVKGADSVIHMDFENYTIGHLINGRHNYDNKHSEYNGVLRQIKWRILNLGYKEEDFKLIDQIISNRSFYQKQKDKAGKVDRYGKKYSWIAYFEVAGIRSEKGLLDFRGDPRISDWDIDPSFPGKMITWKPFMKNFFTNKYHSPKDWIENGGKPDYNHLFQMDKVDGIDGPWVLISGFINESSNTDVRKIFTIINGIFAAAQSVSLLRKKFVTKKYPGNHAIPDAYEDHYTFAGEVPWSEKYGFHLRKNKKAKRHMAECFEEYRQVKIIRQKSKSNLNKITIVRKIIPTINSSSILQELEQLKNAEIILPKRFNLTESRKIPGINVEVPTHRISMSSYSNTENQVGNIDYLAPALCDFLKLKNKHNLHDLFDSDGKQATIFRIFKEPGEYYNSTMLYIRKDLLMKYLKKINHKLILFVWGERDFKIEEYEALKHQVQGEWSGHQHIHKLFKVVKF